MSNLIVSGDIVAGDGRVGLAIQRNEEAAQKRFDEWKAARRPVLANPKTPINDIRNEEIKEWADLHKIKAEVLVGELLRTINLQTEFQAEVEALRAKHPHSTEPSLVKRRDEAFKALNRTWTLKNLFGSPRLNDTNFYGMPIGGEPTWEKDNGETITGLPKDPHSFFREGWRPIRITPDFSARLTALRRILDDRYRAGDVPPAVEQAKRNWIDLRLARYRLVEGSKVLLHEAAIDAALETEVRKYREKLSEIDQNLADVHRELADLGINSRYVC